MGSQKLSELSTSEKQCSNPEEPEEFLLRIPPKENVTKWGKKPK